MDFSTIALIIPAFIAGLLTFLAPCTLPLVPAYLGFISGSSINDLKDPEKAKTAKRRIFKNGIFYVLGFSAVFIIFGTLTGLLGQALAPYRIWLTRIGGAFVILFGLFMLGFFKLNFLNSERKIKIPEKLKKGSSLSSFSLGAAFGFGWTPCVGPILASILLLASTTSSAILGAFLLAVFSFGLSIPFLAVAAGIGKASERIGHISKYLKWVSWISGLILVGVGILLISDRFTLLVSWGFQLLRFINYESILNYL